MADTKLYKVAITPCGKYVHGTEYDLLSLVLNATEDGGDGCSYVSLKRNKNVRPGTDPTTWAISTQRGEQGQRGEDGAGFSYVEVTVDSTSGNPSATCRIENDTFYLDLSGLKGADGHMGQDGAPGVSPVIGQNGNWWTWDASTSQYEDSGNPSRGVAGQDGSDGQNGQDGADGVGFASIATPSPADGTAIITLTNGDTVTLDMNHNHTQYPKYVLCQDEAEYEGITTKDSGTLYLIIDEADV